MAIHLNAQQAQLRFSPDTFLALPGDTLIVAVNIENVQELHGYSITTEFQGLLINCLGVTPGNFLGSQTFFYPIINNTQGWVQVDHVILGTGNQSGSGNLFQMTFQTLAPGFTNLLFIDADLRNSQNDSIPVELDTALIQIGVSGTARNNKKLALYSENISIYPNPFNEQLRIEYFIPQQDYVEMKILDVRGGTVRTLIRGPLASGLHQVIWNGKNDQNQVVGSGVYWVYIKNTLDNYFKKIILIK
ncbi:MAG: hypothetical protein Kow0042_14000 [Calditrichia bacterium]